MCTPAHVAERERVVSLGMMSAFEAKLRRTLEEAITTPKTLKGDEVEAWLRRRLEGLGR